MLRTYRVHSARHGRQRGFTIFSAEEVAVFFMPNSRTLDNNISRDSVDPKFVELTADVLEIIL